jgi:ABC-type branched-subunit amino acid transport system substrate-binding protein
MTRLGLVLLALTAALAMFVVACGDDDKDKDETPAAGKTPVAGKTAAPGGALKIGILFSFTGDLSEFGPNMEKGVKLAVKHINDAGGVNGKDIELKRADDQTSPDPAVSAARQLVDVEGVQAIIGALSSGVTLAVAEAVSIPDGILQISPASTSVALTALEDDDLVFRTTISDLGQGPVLAKVANELGYKKVSTLYVNNAYGQGLSEAFSAAFEELGGEVPAQVSQEQEQPSYLAELQKATEGSPDALAALSYPQSATVYLKEAIENNLIKTFLFCDGTQSLKIPEVVGAATVEGMEGTAAGVGDIGADWRAEFEAEYGELPTLPYITESYDAAIMIALGAIKAGSTDPAAIRDAMRTLNDASGEKITANAAGIKKAVELIKQDKPINYEGASGFSGWDDKGDVSSGYIQVWKYEGGKIVTIRVEKITLQ